MRVEVTFGKAGAPPPLTREQLGMIAVHLALTFPVWVRRRKTSYGYVDDTTVRQLQSIDFHLPPPEAFPKKAQPHPGQTIYVPLWIGDKSPLVKFSLTDESGTAVRLLNEVETTRLAVDGVSAIVRGLSDGRGTFDSDTLCAALKEILVASPGEGAKMAEAALAPGGDLDSVPSESIYSGLVLELATGRMMLVPVVYEPEADRILKMGHHSSQAWGNVSSKYVVSRVALRVLASLSLVDKRQGLQGLPIGWAQSTHFEFEPPEDVNLGVARLDCEQWDSGAKSCINVPRRRVVSGQPAVDLGVKPLVEFDAHEPEHAKREAMLAELLKARGDTAEVRLQFGPSISSVFLPSVIASVATCAILGLALARLGDLHGETSAALLLLFPATAAAFLARPGEHAFATRLLKGVRWSTALVAACAVVTVGVISGGLIRPKPEPNGRSVMTCKLAPTRSPLSTPGSASGQVGTPMPPAMPRRARCVQRRRASSRPPVRDDSHTVVAWAVRVATVITLTLVIAMVLTHVKVRRRSEKGHEENLDDVPASSP